MAKMSDYGEEMLVTSANGVTFDLNKDYSKAISEAKARGEDTTALEQQRQAKIDSKAYGGAYKTNVNENASLGDTYDEEDTVVNRTSNSSPVVTTKGNTVTTGASTTTPVAATPATSPQTTTTPATSTGQPMSEYGPATWVTSAGGVTFDLNADYTARINALDKNDPNYAAKKAELERQRQAKIDSKAYGGQYKTGVNEAASLGTTYNPTETLANRTSNSDPLTVAAKPVTPAPSDAAIAGATLPTLQGLNQYTALSQSTQPTLQDLNQYTALSQSTQPTLQDLNQLQTGTYTAPNIDSTINKADISAMISYLDQWLAQAKQQQSQSIDYATETAVKDLQRTEEEAAKTFQEQRNQIAIEEARAKDNQALYAERRGDRGGVGAAQYDSVMNTAAKNRLAVNNAQTKLATDTSRQIADLRAQGEYEKADALLNLTQQYLSQIISLEQWSMDYGLSEAQFRASLQQWEANFEAQMAEITGVYKGQQTLAYQQAQNELIKYQNDLALSKEQLAMQQAGLTGFYNGQATLEYQQAQNDLIKYQNDLALSKEQLAMQQAGLTGYYNGQQTLAYQQAQNDLIKYQNDLAAAQTKELASNGWTLLEAGMMPSASQLKAMGLTSAQAEELASYYQTQGKINESADSHIQKMLGFNDDGKALTYLSSLGYSNDVHNQLWAMYEQESAATDDSKLIEKASAMTVDQLSSKGRTLLDTIRRSYPYSGNGKLPGSALDMLENSDLSDLEIYAILALLGYNLKDYL